ncbi:MAG: c-type cytochrome [Psychromonas sp.]
MIFDQFRRYCIAASCLLLITSPTFASTSPTIQTCTSCHGADGLGVANFTPALAGLSEAYLTSQIELYMTGRRVNSMMTPMSSLLKDPKLQKQTLAYFAALPAAEITELEKPGEHAIILDPARRLIYQGDWSRDIPACSTCHGPSGQGVAAFPRLANQHSEYIEGQLLMWQSGMRRGDHNNVMGNIASKLTKTEISQLAQYFATVK